MKKLIISAILILMAVILLAKPGSAEYQNTSKTDCPQGYYLQGYGKDNGLPVCHPEQAIPPTQPTAPAPAADNPSSDVVVNGEVFTGK